jgi:hypothetical protein
MGEEEGKHGEGRGLFVGMVGEKKRQVLNQELKRRIYRGETVAGVKFGPGKKKAPR